MVPLVPLQNHPNWMVSQGNHRHPQTTSRSPSSALPHPLLGEASPTTILKKKGTLILTSLLEDLDMEFPVLKIDLYFCRAP